MKNKQYILKEISCEKELETFLRLRYNCFSKSDSGVFVTKNNNDIDLNYYDRNSNHYGLYLVQNNSKEPVGYFRIILEGPTKADTWIQNISKKLRLNYLTEHMSIPMFPCFGIYPNNKIEQDFYTKKQLTEKAGEASRLLIVEAERSLGLSLQLIKNAVAIAALYIQHAFVGCFEEHSKAYTRLGFKQYPGSSVFLFDLLPVPREVVILHCKSEYLSGELKAKLQAIQNQYAENKSLTFYL